MMTILREIKSKWKPRKRTSHKGDFGRVFIVAGSHGLTGAAYLSAVAAMRAGAGLVTLGVPESIYSILAKRAREVMVSPFPATASGALAARALKTILKFSENQDVLALGPGLSQNRGTQKLVRELISKSACPVVVDADGLNALVGKTECLARASGRLILTPHPGEFLRVFGGSLTAEGEGRKKRARQVARQHGVVMVLKGNQTVVAHPDGRVYVNSTGNPGMASGGTGDVLTGILAALIGQHFSLWDAARFGVYLHGLAGDLARAKVGEISLIAGDVLDFLPQAICKTRG